MAIETYFENIAAAIKQRAGTSGSLTPAQMPQAILDIPGGSTPTLITKSITQNGTYNASADNADGYSSVVVSVPGGGRGALVEPDFQGNCYPYVTSDGTSVYTSVNKTTYLSIFTVYANHKYALYVGNIVGSRRRATFMSGKTINDFIPYLDTQPSSQTEIFSGGVWLAPFTQGTDDTGNALAGRIIYTPSSDGVILYATNSTGADIPAYCVDMSVTSGGSSLIIKSITQNGTYNASTDNADGYSSVLVNVPSGGNIQVADWNFAESDTDIISGYGITNKSYATKISTGYQFTNSGSYIRFPSNMVGCSKTYVIDMGDMNLNSDGNDKRFFMSSGQNGFIYRSTGVWGFYNGSWATDSTLTNFDYFANSKVGIYIDANAFWHIYKDGNLVYDSNKASTVLSENAAPMLMIGSLSGNSARTITIKGFKVYLGNIYA